MLSASDTIVNIPEEAVMPDEKKTQSSTGITARLRTISPAQDSPTLHRIAAHLRPWRSVGLLIAADLVALALANLIALHLRLWLGGDVSSAQYLALWPLLAVFPAAFAVLRLYGSIALNPADELRRLTMGCGALYLGLGTMAFLSRQGEAWSRGVWLLAIVFSVLTLPLCRAALRAICSRRAWWGHPVLVIGAGLTAEMVIRQLHRHPSIGLKPVLILDDDNTKHGELLGVPVLGGLELAPRVARETDIRHAIVAMPGASPERLAALDHTAGDSFPRLILIPPLVGYASMWVEAKDLGGVLGLEVKHRLLFKGPRLTKRILDLTLIALCAIPVGLLMLALALTVRCTSRGPAFYGQLRIGLGGKKFTAWKFRSMMPNADAVLAKHISDHPELRAEWEKDHKLRNDPRITWIGRILRKTSLDELPQLWNVIRGEMSLVGPRPIVDAEVAKYGEHFALYARALPGISGLWQVSGRNDTTYAERVALDCSYVRNWSPWLDVLILGKTVSVVIFSKGAY